MSRYVVNLESRAGRDARLVGGKGAGLNWLVRRRFNVPPGFVLTTRAYHDFMAGLGAPSDPTAERESIVREILAAPIPPAVCREVRRAYARLGGSVAVRSSAPSEDAEQASHAGQFETQLDVTGEEAVLQAVRVCWASLFTERAAGYLETHCTACDLTMAVVVQRMVPAVAAGVAFSADPITAQPCVIIEAAPGKGTGVVGGGSRTDRYVIDGRGVLSEFMPVLAGRPALSESQALSLAQIVVAIEQMAGRPQDVEWAWDGAAFHILQARPITTLQDRHTYSRRIVSDMAPGLVRPLVYDVNTLAKVREVFGALFRALLGPTDIDTSRLVTRLHSRVYADMTVLGELLTRAGLPANLFEMMFRDERRGRVRMGMGRMLLVSARMIPLVFRAGRLGGEQGRRLDEARRNLQSFKARDWAVVSLPDLLSELGRVTALRDNLFWFFFCAVFNGAARTRLLRTWLDRRAPHVAFADLIRGLYGLKSLEPSLELVQLAEVARGLSAEDLAALADGDDAPLRPMLAQSPQGQALLQGVDAFLLRHGYLSSNGSDFSAPSWNESRALIWRSIGRGVSSNAAGNEAPAETIRAAAVAEVRRSVGPVDRWVFGRLMAAAATAIDLRERSSMLISEHTYEMRRLFLAIAGELAARDCLAEVEDIFYLGYEEMRALCAGALDPALAAGCIRERRAVMARDAGTDPPEVIVAEPGQAGAPSIAPQPAAGAEYLTGIGGSPGVVKGIARVIYDPVDAPATLCRSDILVVPFSDVGWTPLFSGIGGIVAETGGQLSHTAIVAREYNLPAVVSVRDATRRICDGQAVTLDGSLGRVYLKPENA